MTGENSTSIIPNGSCRLPASIAIPTAARMRSLGAALGTQLRAGDLVILSGGLGAGKTTLTQGIAEGLGVRGPITSPTFVIARVHPSLRGRTGPALVHVDAYRLGGVAELDDLDLDTDTATSVTVVEWGEGLAEGLADDRLEVAIEVTAPDLQAAAYAGVPEGTDVPETAEDRTVRIAGVGERWREFRLTLPEWC